MAIIVMMVMAIQFVSYVVLEVWQSDGLLVMGALVGIVNSNAILQLMGGAKTLAKIFVRISIPIVVAGLLVVSIELVLF